MFSIVLVVVSFIGMASLVIHNARQIKTGNVHKLRPMNLFDLARPTVEVWKNTMRGVALLVWGNVLKWFHVVSFNAGKKFLEIAWMVRGKRKLVRDAASANSIWKEVAYERDRIRAHFSDPQDVLG